MKITPPSKADYPEFYHTYIGKVTTIDLLPELKTQLILFQSLFHDLSEDQLSYRYEKDKWNLKELLIHIIDSERVFAYRALRFGRGDNTPLPGFDQNIYGDHIKGIERNIKSILDEFEFVRKSTIALFENFNEKDLNNSGEASGGMVTVRAIGYMILGHALHHRLIIEERYLF